MVTVKILQTRTKPWFFSGKKISLFLLVLLFCHVALGRRSSLRISFSKIYQAPCGLVPLKKGTCNKYYDY